MIVRYLFLIVSVFAYCLGILLGISQAVFQSDNQYLDKGESNFKEVFSSTPFQRFQFIAKNNMIVGFKNFLYGMFSLGLFSIIYAFFNGLLLGIVLSKSSKILSKEVILESTLPHSFEIIGFILFGYLGFILSMKLLLKKQLFSYKTLICLGGISSVIIIFAAFIESYISMS